MIIFESNVGNSHSKNNNSFNLRNKPFILIIIIITYNYNASLRTKDQSIVFTSLDDPRMQDYLLELDPIVNPRNVIDWSCISNNRIYIYISVNKFVDNFLRDYGEITFSSTKIPARKLITLSEKL